MAGIASAESKWDSGDYFGAGVELGKLELIVSKPWYRPLPTAAQNFLN